MLYIEGLENNQIKLEKSTDLTYSFKVVSKKPNNRPIPFFVEHISNENITTKITFGDTIDIYTDASLIEKEEFIVLSNTIGEFFRIKIIPNEYYTMERTYSFKITSKKFLDDGSLELKVFSKVNDEEIGWKCTYDGKPMSYTISPLDSTESKHVHIVPNGEIMAEFKVLVEFTQDESDNKIRLLLTNTPELGITNVEKKVD